MTKKITLESLAGMIKKGFDENNKQHHQIFKVLNGHTKVLNGHTKRLDNLEQGQEEIKLKLDQVAYPVR